MHRCIGCKGASMKSAEPVLPAGPTPRVVPFRSPRHRRREELAFLPAALEIVETPPSPIGRAIGIAIIALFCTALLWAGWGTIDIVASATGKILPSGRTKVVQPFETGMRVKAAPPSPARMPRTSSKRSSERYSQGRGAGTQNVIQTCFSTCGIRWTARSRTSSARPTINAGSAFRR